MTGAVGRIAAGWTVVAVAVALSGPRRAAEQEAPPPSQPERFPVRIESRYYRIFSTATEEQARRLGEVMDLVCVTYADLLTDNAEDERRMLGQVRRMRPSVFLYANYRQYARNGPPGSGAYYDPESGILVGFHDENLMHAFFAHEGMHQFTDLAAGSIMNFPMWYIEGIADCIGNSEVRGNELYLARQDGVIARMRLPVIRAALERDRAWSLERLCSLDRTSFMRNAALGYAQAWSFCHFLLAYPAYGSDRRIPNGTYRWNLSIFHSSITSGRSVEEAMRNAFSRTENGQPLGLDRLEAQWREWVRNYPAVPAPPRIGS
jgi:hypothetical protein